MDHELANGLDVETDRHTGVRHLAKHFAFGHLPEHLQEISRRFAELGQFLVESQHDGPELTEALRKLWEAKNCAVLHAGFLSGREPANG